MSSKFIISPRILAHFGEDLIKNESITLLELIKNYLEINSGIRVYRDGIRVYDYGEKENDWLGIDLKRVHRVGGRISNNIVVGSVKLNRLQSKGLKEKTNREGFVENDAYFVFMEYQCITK